MLLRIRRLSWSRMRLKTPAAVHRLKNPNTVLKGGKSFGRALHLRIDDVSQCVHDLPARVGLRTASRRRLTRGPGQQRLQQLPLQVSGV